jgi:hypothetical protein
LQLLSPTGQKSDNKNKRNFLPLNKNYNSMNEIILIIIFLAILFGLQIVINQIKKPLVYYVRISSAIALVLLVWLFGGDNNIPVKVILSVLALTGLYNGYLSIKKIQSNK